MTREDDNYQPEEPPFYRNDKTLPCGRIGYTCAECGKFCECDYV